jgi:hypothetical protein
MGRARMWSGMTGLGCDAVFRTDAPMVAVLGHDGVLACVPE